MKLYKKTKLYLSGLLAVFACALFFGVASCSAYKVAYSPIRQEKILVPGTTDDLTLTLSTPSDATEDADYELEVRPFSVDDNNETHLEAKGNYSLLASWIEIPEDVQKGTLKPNETKQINCTITVPSNAPAGGQYVAIVIKTFDRNDQGIGHVFEMTHMVYAEVAGETIRQGEIESLDVPSFLFSGKITGSATVKNLGNVHSTVKHTLKVFPLFGDEEFFTNEENPQDNNIVMPETSRFSSITWDGTPSIGIFRVHYIVEFEGVKNEVEKIVIVCPIWLLAIIAAFVAVLIYSLLTRGRHKKSKVDQSID